MVLVLHHKEEDREEILDLLKSVTKVINDRYGEVTCPFYGKEDVIAIELEGMERKTE